jgi:hypothetical protein
MCPSQVPAWKYRLGWESRFFQRNFTNLNCCQVPASLHTMFFFIFLWVFLLHTYNAKIDYANLDYSLTVHIQKCRAYWDTGVELDASLFHSSQHWTDTYITGGFSPHIRSGGFLPIIPPRLNTTILRGLSTITNCVHIIMQLCTACFV